MKMMLPIHRAFALLALCVAMPSFGEVVVSNAWIASSPPGGRAMAGYFTAHNNGTTDVRILKAASPDFERIELHTVVHEGELHRMQPADGITVPAGDNVVLQPGELHLMLIGPSCQLKEGDKVFIRLTLEDGAQVPATFEIRPRQVRPSSDSQPGSGA